MDRNEVSSIARARSKSYPAISLREAISRCQTLYEKDGWSGTLAETAGTHWGYAGLNGGSRPILAALKQFGLLEYSGGGDNLKVRLTDLAKRILRPVQPEEKAHAVSEAMLSPKLYASLHEKFPDWNLPSDATLSARLEREEGIQPKAIRSLVADIKDSVAYLTELSGNGVSAPKSGTIAPDDVTDNVILRVDETPLQNYGATQTYPMPGGEAYVVLPKSLTPEEADRTKKWITKVIIPAIDFAGDLE